MNFRDVSVQAVQLNGERLDVRIALRQRLVAFLPRRDRRVEPLGPPLPFLVELDFGQRSLLFLPLGGQPLAFGNLAGALQAGSGRPAHRQLQV